MPALVRRAFEIERPDIAGLFRPAIATLVVLVGTEWLGMQWQVDSWLGLIGALTLSAPLIFAIVFIIGELYAAADLDIGRLEKTRLQAKTVTGPDGQRTRSHAVDRQMYWSELADLPNHIKSDVNANQIRLLSDENKERFLAVAGSTMEKLGYL